MAAKTVADLIKEARTDAGLTQEQLARKIAGLSAEDISAAERGLTSLTQVQLKAIAKATGVTQASLLNAPKPKAASKKTTTAKTTSAKKTTTVKTPASANSTMKVTATERKLVEAYRGADANLKKAALALLKGETTEAVTAYLTARSGNAALGGLAGNLVGNILNRK